MLEVTQQPRQLLFTSPGWRLNFEWKQDRWQHSLSELSGDVWQSQLISLEDGTDQAWPDSPAFQYAQVERLGESIAEVQLLGQAGRNHYSGAVRCDATVQVIEFDLAVRIQSQPPAPLHLSTYQVISPDFLNVWQFQVEQLEQQPLSCLEKTPDSKVCLTMPDVQELWSRQPRVTLRWKYRWRLKSVA